MESEDNVKTDEGEGLMTSDEEESFLLIIINNNIPAVHCLFM